MNPEEQERSRNGKPGGAKADVETQKGTLHTPRRKGGVRKFLGVVCCVVGAILVAGALGVFLHNAWLENQAEESADAAMEQMEEMLPLPDAAENDDGLPVTAIDGYEFIGYLSIPALELNLPVLADWDMTRLNYAPCLYYGSYKTDDMVIAGHSYKRHFRYLSSLGAGETVYFISVTGETYSYAVVSSEVIAPTDISQMLESEYDLSLFTCTYDGSARFTLRCVDAT